MIDRITMLLIYAIEVVEDV